jgi:hypothetical protein
MLQDLALPTELALERANLLLREAGAGRSWLKRRGSRELEAGSGTLRGIE